VKEKNERLGNAGGQALIEGIMMNGPKGAAAIAVRRGDGAIIVRKKKFVRLKDRVKILGWPVIRGVAGFIESMAFGYKCLMESAEVSGMLEIEEAEEESKLDKWLGKHLGENLTKVITVIAMIFSVILTVFLFMYLPSLAVDGLNSLAAGAVVKYNLKAFAEGIIRMAIFVAYLFLVSRMKDIKRTFMYHGAEHKTIFCYEAGEELSVENVKNYKRFHPRCGTSFIFSVMIISIIVSSLILVFFPSLKENRLLWTGVKIMIMPVLAGIGYEFIRFSGKHDNIFTRIMAFPGILMQRLTTAEPTDDMLEVAIASLEAVITEEDFEEKILNAPEEGKDENP